MKRIVIAGAGLSGSRCAETLRALGFDGEIVLVGDEPVPPYERPALSKEFLLGDRTPDELALRPAGFWQEREIELVLGRRVTRLRAGAASLEDGTELGWDRFVVATGARPRHLGLPVLEDLHVLRTVADAMRLRATLEPGRRLAVVGGGFVGAEVASTARALDVRVTVLEAAGLPFSRLLGLEVARLLADRARAHGLDLRTGSTTTGLRVDAGGRLAAVRLDDGSEIACDAALVAVGAEPVQELAADPPPNVYVCGDAAGGPGHWTSAALDGAAAAHELLGLEPPPLPPPFFWSDQFGLRLQLVGDTRSSVLVELEGDERSFLARYLGRDGRLLAVLGANRSAQIGMARRELALAA